MRHLFLEGRDPFVTSTLDIKARRPGRISRHSGIISGVFFDLRRKGMSVRSSVDCLIAQTAIEHGLHLLHNDSDFDRIAKVSALKIWQPTPAGRG